MEKLIKEKVWHGRFCLPRFLKNNPALCGKINQIKVWRILPFRFLKNNPAMHGNFHKKSDFCHNQHTRA